MRAIMQMCARASAWALCLCVISARACVHVRVRVLYMCGQLYMFVRVCARLCVYVHLRASVWVWGLLALYRAGA